VEKRPGAVALAKRLRRARPKTGEHLSLRRISSKLAEAGYRIEFRATGQFSPVRFDSHDRDAEKA
jgi:hypothetical protein